jgi:very-short-patch-repair endonuclease
MNKIKFVREKSFYDCTNISRVKKTIKRCYSLPFDFYIPNFNVCIEYDGAHHFKAVFSQESFENRKKLDKIKNQYCEENGIKLIRIPYTMKNDEIEPYILKELGIK